jgi:hypothetical protein
MGLDWCMIKAGVRYTRIPDPAHVLSVRGGLTRADTVGPSVKKLNKRFVHSFIHSLFRPIQWYHSHSDPIWPDDITLRS